MAKAKEAGRSFGGCEPLAAHVGGDGPGDQSALAPGPSIGQRGQRVEEAHLGVGDLKLFLSVL